MTTHSSPGIATLLPCPFCQKPVPLGWLFVHRSGEHGIITKSEADAKEWVRRGHEARPVYLAQPQSGSEPVAWTNQAQLGFLREPRYNDVPMAMWAKQTGTAQIPLYTAQPQPTLTADFAQSLPGGKLDDSTYEKIETALDKIDAPCRSADGKWLALHERIAAISTEQKP